MVKGMDKIREGLELSTNGFLESAVENMEEMEFLKGLDDHYPKVRRFTENFIKEAREQLSNSLMYGVPENKLKKLKSKYESTIKKLNEKYDFNFSGLDW